MTLLIVRTDAEPVPETATQHLVAMRDQAELATDVYLPQGPGPFPTALTRLPYDKNSRYVFMGAIAAYWNERGYAVVVQDVRGKFRSGGETRPFVHEPADGYDTIQWVTEQAWSDGRVGMFGDSYYGATQWAAVSSRHPALKAIAPRVTGADGIRPDAWAKLGAMPLFGLLYYLGFWSDRHTYEFEPDLACRPLVDALEEVVEAIGTRMTMWETTFPEVKQVDAYPFGHPFDGPPLPVLHQVGWYDNCLPSSIGDYVELAGRADWAALQYLDADSIDHENHHLDDWPITEDMDHAVSDEALAGMLPRYLDSLIAFFDVYVKQVAAPEVLPQVRWHQGNLGYRTAVSWPPPGTRTLDLHLGGADAAGTNEAGGALTAEPPAGASVGTWTHDPQDLVPSVVPESFSQLAHSADETSVHGRPDVLTFTTEPALQPLDLAGPITATLTVGTDGPSAHMFLKVCDVSPDGTSRVIVRGQGLIEGGDVTAVTADLTHTGYRLLPGHSLRLHVASSDFPLFVPHPGTDENPWLATGGQSTVQTLRTGVGTSYLTLTVVEDLS
ncbi:CocE/NonD family hydrolase [Streptomyces sp. NPDC097727]|uniref:CocE/NonD family hydrolase n=1 Tax=Streptomyces sp. NPDC097727 TaxID=3366092 RepID=UPI0038233CF3